MFNFLPQILIILALAAIIVIIVRKFPKTGEIAKKEERKESVSSKKAEKIGRAKSILRLLGNRFRAFTVFIFKRSFYQFTKLRKKKPAEVETVSHLVSEKPVIRQATNEDKILDLLEQAAKFFGSGNFQKAEETYIEIIKLDPKNIRAYKGLGKIYKKQGNTKDAKASFEQVVRIKPGDSEAREELKSL
jgi:Flp pilus assembly protein TadD